jgi:hypothetical protein
MEAFMGCVDSKTDLVSAYREMAADHEREAEAEQWCEGLIGDAYETDPIPEPAKY